MQRTADRPAFLLAMASHSTSSHARPRQRSLILGLVRRMRVTLLAAIYMSAAILSVAATDQDPISLAKTELVRRHLPLPKGYSVAVMTSTAFVEGPAADYPIYLVVFRLPSRGKSKTLYEVSIDRRTHRIDNVSDFLHAVPAHR